jgi:hypothetical protein
MANAFCTVDYFDASGGEKSFSLADEGVESIYAWRDDGFDCEVFYAPAEIRLTLRMELDGSRVSFETPSIPQDGACLMKSVSFMPFLGTVQESAISGYMFVPDGCGALIRFRSGAQYISTFEKKVYGKDYGIDTEAVSYSSVIDEPQALMPVYGIAHVPGENAVFAILEQGEEYATIKATVAGTITNYNWACARFDYRQLYMQPVNRRGTGVQAPQPFMNEMLPKISFHFLTGEDADYAGMARLYRSLLLESGKLASSSPKSESIPLRIDLLGADIKAGFLSKAATPFTTVKQAEEIVKSLEASGVSNLTLVYKGWQKGGVNGGSYGQTSFEPKLGSEKAFAALRDLVSRFFLSVTPALANKDQINEYFQSATTLSKSYMITLRYRNFFFSDYYFLRPSAVSETMEKMLKAHPGMELAVDQAGYLLYSDNTRGHEVSRRQAKELFGQLEAKAWIAPNAFLWDEAEIFLDIPMVSSQYLFESDTVPFLQIALRGSMQYYAACMNTSAQSPYVLLKLLEYGAYPSFMLTGEPSQLLRDTPQEDLFSTYYVDWVPTIAAIYGKANSALKKVEGCEITDHQAVSDGVARTVYSGGPKSVEVFVNYGAADFTYQDVLVPALSFAIREGALS